MVLKDEEKSNKRNLGWSVEVSRVSWVHRCPSQLPKLLVNLAKYSASHATAAKTILVLGENERLDEGGVWSQSMM